MIPCKSDRAVTIRLDIAGPPVLKLPSPHRPSSGELKDLRSNGTTAFFLRLYYFMYVYRCFSCMYASASHVHLVPSEGIRLPATEVVSFHVCPGN